jgi:hypothetical protein
MKKLTMDNIIDLIKNSDDIEKALSLVLNADSELQAKLIKEIGNFKSSQVSQFLTRLLEESTGKILQKTIKKMLFRLKTQGIAVEDPRPSGESVLHKITITRAAEALMSTYDSELTRIVVAAFELKKNLFAISHGIIHFSKGLLELKSLPVSRIDLGALMNDYQTNPPSSIVFTPISPVYSGYLLEEASRISGKETSEVHSLTYYLKEAASDVRKPSDIYHLPLGQSDATAGMEDIVTDKAFEPIHLEWQGMEKDQQAFEKAANPSIVLPPYVIQERIEGTLKEIVGSDRLNPLKPLLKRLLEDMAYLFYCLGRKDRYKSLVEALSNDTGLNKYLIFFVQKTFYDTAKKTTQQPEVIVDPFSRSKGL